jgi:hypothetical protein
MKKTVLITLAAMAASPAFAGGQIRKAECDTDISECYSIMQASCPGGFSVVDRNSFYGDGLVRELPPRMLFFSRQYNEYLYRCG